MWNGEFLEIRKQYREIGLRFQNAAKLGLEKNHLPCGLWQVLTEFNLFQNAIEYNNEEGIIYACAALEGLSYGLLDLGTMLSLMAHIGLGITTIHKYAKGNLKDYYLNLIKFKGFILCFAVSEIQGGSNPQDLKTTISNHKNGFLLNGKKWLITNGEIANLIITFAKDNITLEPVAVMVDPGFQGIERKIMKTIGMKSSPLAQISFNNVFIPTDYLLGSKGEGIEILNQAFLRDRLLAGFVITGITERVLEVVMELFEEKRKISRHSIANYQYIRKLITDIAIILETTRAISQMTIDAFRKKSLDFNLYASISKYYSTDRSLNSCINTIQIMGSYGILENLENNFVEHFLSAISSTIAGGTEEMHREAMYSVLYRKFRKRKKTV